MADHHNFTHQIWRTATIAVALAACLIFGVIILAGGDWLPGAIIVAASVVGLARAIPVIRQLCSTDYPSSPRKQKPAR